MRDDKCAVYCYADTESKDIVILWLTDLKIQSLTHFYTLS